MKVFQTKQWGLISMVESETKPERITRMMIEDQVDKLILQTRNQGEDPIQLAQDTILDPLDISMDDEELLERIMESEEVLYLLSDLTSQKVIEVKDTYSLEDFELLTLHQYLMELWTMND